MSSGCHWSSCNAFSSAKQVENLKVGSSSTLPVFPSFTFHGWTNPLPLAIGSWMSRSSSKLRYVDVRNWLIDCLSYFYLLLLWCAKKYDQSWVASGKNPRYHRNDCWSLLVCCFAWLQGKTSPNFWSLGGVATSVPEWFKLGTSSQESFASLSRSWERTLSISTPMVGWRGFIHCGEDWIIPKQLPIDSTICILAWPQ